MNKICKLCEKELPVDFYYRHNGYKDGRVSKCRDCYNKHHSDIRAKASKEYYEKNKESLNKDRTDRSRRATEEVKKVKRAAEKAWRQRNKEKVYAYNAEVRAKKLQATPPWIDEEHKNRIASIYRAKLKINERTGKEHHVDHVVPLQGKNVCGLHVWWNLAIIPAKMNLEKNNSFEGGLDG